MKKKVIALLAILCFMSTTAGFASCMGGDSSTSSSESSSSSSSNSSSDSSIDSSTGSSGGSSVDAD